jgi:hypothetical protein
MKTHAAFAGSAEALFKATDSSTGQLFGEWVDKGVGGMAVSDATHVAKLTKRSRSVGSDAMFIKLWWSIPMGVTLGVLCGCAIWLIA